MGIRVRPIRDTQYVGHGGGLSSCSRSRHNLLTLVVVLTFGSSLAVNFHIFFSHRLTFVFPLDRSFSARNPVLPIEEVKQRTVPRGISSGKTPRSAVVLTLDDDDANTMWTTHGTQRVKIHWSRMKKDVKNTTLNNSPFCVVDAD